LIRLDVSQRRHGQSCAVVIGFSQDQTQVFAHVIHRKAKAELVYDHGFATVFKLPALCCAFANHVQHKIHVQLGLESKGHGFAQTLQQAGDTNLVDHFGQLSCATVPHACHRF
jgi:hypothetical protein